MALDLDLTTTTAAAVKAKVDARLESAWRASGVRILRSDLPFRGIILSYQEKVLAMDHVLSRCKVREGSTLIAEWPRESERDERRKRYGSGWDSEAVVRKRVREEREAKRAERQERSTKREALHGGG